MAEGGADFFGSESVFEFYCEFCNEEGLHKEAVGHCSECDEYLCRSCVSNHSLTRLTRHHEVLDKENMPMDTPPSSNRVRTDITTMCKHHKGEPVKYYCKSHDELTCSGCIVNSHKSCINIINITETSRTFFNDKEYKDFILDLRSLEDKVKNINSKSLDQIETSGRCCSEAIDAVRQFRDDIICTLDDIEAHLKKEADDIKSRDVAKMESIENTCSTQQERLGNHLSDFESLESNNRICQAFIKIKETSKDIKEIERQLRKAEEKNTINVFSFIPNTKLTDILSDINAFGLICVNSKGNTRQTQDRVSSIVSSTIVSQNTQESSVEDKTTKNNDTGTTQNQVILAQFVHDINVDSASDSKQCWITGSVMLSDIELLVVDNSNCKIKVINTRLMQISRELQVNGNPWDVTVIPGNNLAVTIPVHNTIIVLNVKKSIIKKREMYVEGECYGIDYRNNSLVVSYNNPAKIEIMDLKGNIKNTFDSRNGVKMFKRPNYVCVSNDGDTIYVSDYKMLGGSVLSLSLNGDIKSTPLKGPQKLCIDLSGNLFVCEYNNRNIHMIIQDCTKTNVILTKIDGLSKEVCSVSHCSETNRLYVGMRMCDKVVVYQLS